MGVHLSTFSENIRRLKATLSSTVNTKKILQEVSQVHWSILLSETLLSKKKKFRNAHKKKKSKYKSSQR